MGKPRSSPKRKPLPRFSDDSDSEASFFPAFLLGVAVALILVTVPIFSGIYWMCKDVPAIAELECPHLISNKKNESKGGFSFPFLGKKSSSKDIEIELVAPDPVQCACRLFSGFFKGENQEPQTPQTCIPKEKDILQIESRKRNPELMEKYKVAYTSERLQIPSAHEQLIITLKERLLQLVPDFEERSKKVTWGGSKFEWFDPKQMSKSDATDLEKLEGGALFYAYLRIMQWPQSLYSHFPFKLCAKGCNSEVALAHTLEFREKYQPWMISPTVKKENNKGFIFYHGFSGPREEHENVSHSIVWIRPGLRNKIDDIAQTRAYVNTLDRAVAASLERSNGRVGKFNVVLDGTGFSMGLTPSLHHVKVFVTMLQDHYPDRVGIILLANLGRIGELVAKMFLKLITEEVRNKIIILSRDPKERQELLNTVVGYENSPVWLGGTDAFEFNSDEYYADEQFMFSDEEAKAYQETMPYHS